MLFYLVWEAKQSYCIPFLFLLTVLAVHGLHTADDYLDVKWKPKRAAGIKAVFCVFSAAVLLTTLCFGITRYSDFTQKTGDYRDISVLCCNTSNLKQIKNIAKNDNALTQAFFTDKAFNTIELQVKKLDGDASYRVALTDSNSNILLNSTVYGSDVGKDGLLRFSIPDTPEKQDGYYQLKIKRAGGKTDSIGWTYCFSRESDLYCGVLSINSAEKPYDLMLGVYRLQREAYMPSIGYLAVIACILLFEVLVFFAVGKRMFKRAAVI